MNGSQFYAQNIYTPFNLKKFNFAIKYNLIIHKLKL